MSDESMQKCFGEGSGLVYQDVLSWLQSSNTQLQLSGALAIANFARNGEIFERVMRLLYMLDVQRNHGFQLIKSSCPYCSQFVSGAPKWPKIYSSFKI